MYDTPQRGPSPNASSLVLSVQDDFEPGCRSAEWGCDEARINRFYVNRLIVQTASPSVGPLSVMGAIGVKIGDSYRFPLFTYGATETDTGSFVRAIKVDQHPQATDNRQWHVTITYEPQDTVTLLGSSDLAKGIICPTDRAPEVYWGEPAKYRRSKPYDESGEDEETGEPGRPFLNTAGDPLLDPPETEETRPVLFFVRNQSTYNDAWASQYKDTVNADEFLGFPPNTVKCRDIKGERWFDPDWGYFFRCTYQFEFRDDEDGQGFTLLIASMGYRQLKDGSGSPVNVNDANGQQVTDAVPLQQDGSYQPGKPPHMIAFSEFPSSTFADLNIPDDILFVASGST